MSKNINYQTLQNAAEILRLLAHADRLNICQFLIDGEKSVSEIADSLDLKQNVTSQHLSFMKRQGLIDCRRDGKNVYYKIVHAAPKMLLQCIKNSI